MERQDARRHRRRECSASLIDALRRSHISPRAGLERAAAGACSAAPCGQALQLREGQDVDRRALCELALQGLARSRAEEGG